MGKKSKLEKFLKGIEWKPIVINGESTKYDVSNTGMVRNIHGKILSPFKTKKGYLVFTLSVNEDKYTRSAHQLVAIAFISNPENKLTVNHKDGNKENNNVSNLEWMTNKENVRHAWENGLNKAGFGNDANASKYTENQVREICQLLEENKLTNIEIAKITGVSDSIVSKIKIKNCWTHISDEYDIPEPISNPKGADHPSSKYTEDQIHQVCKMLEEGKENKTNIAKITGVKNDMITHIAAGRYWTHVSSQYKLPEFVSNTKISDKDKQVIDWINQKLDNDTIASKLLADFGMSDRKIARECIYRVKRKYPKLLSGSTTIEHCNVGVNAA